METYNKIVKILHDNFGVDSGSITSTSLLKEDLGLDSLDITELNLAVEEEFDIQFNEKIRFRTLGELANLVEAIIFQE